MCASLYEIMGEREREREIEGEIGYAIVIKDTIGQGKMSASG